MIELDKKYVFHIPVHRFETETGQVVNIDMEILLDELVYMLNKEGYHSFYMSDVKGFYKNRSFDELLITIFVGNDDTRACDIFKEWFKKNNNMLKQESFAYECNNKLFIEEITS